MTRDQQPIGRVGGDTMRIQVLSDLHAEVDPEHAQRDVVDLGADLVILAGDIDHGGAGVRWAADTWPDTPIVYVLGNHEHYGSMIEATLDRARAAAAGKNVHVLEREAITIQGVRILGATLWTDFRLSGDAAFAKAGLGQAFPDYQAIEGAGGGRLRPAETEAIHNETVRWIRDTLAESHDGPTIVVTHHAPSSRALGQWDEWAGESPWTVMDAAFASDLELLIDLGKPDAWIHGHTHRSSEYQVPDTHLEATRVISNQRGYYQETSGWDPTYVLELTTSPTLRERREQRARERRTTARACARTALEMLAGHGIEACVVGSLARGDFDLHSDVDFLVFSPITGGEQLRLAAEIDHCFDGSDISVDVTYRDDLDDANLERMTRHMLTLPDLQ